MEKREKLEIPIIEFTKVTLLGTPVSTCCAGDENEEVGQQTGVGLIGQDCAPISGI